MQSLCLDPISRTATAPRPGFFRRWLDARTLPSIRELDAAMRKDIGIPDEQRTPDEVRDAYHLWMRVDDLRGL